MGKVGELEFLGCSDRMADVVLSFEFSCLVCSQAVIVHRKAKQSYFNLILDLVMALS